MSHEVDQKSVLQRESTESDAGSEKMMSQLQLEEEKKPEVVIKASDLKIVQQFAHLDRAGAIELISNADGDIKQALRNYVLK
jgi:NACalpha-BTF3-like transcription factor